MSNINDIISTNWQLSIKGPGQIAQGLDDINQGLLTLCSTRKYTSPLSPDKGLDLLAWQDKPVMVKAPGLVKEIIEQVALYEPRINLQAVQYTPGIGKIVFRLVWFYAPGYGDSAGAAQANTTLMLLADEGGFVLITDDNYALILN